MQKQSRIYVAGAETLMGGAILRLLHDRGFSHVLGRTSETPDLRDRASVDDFFETNAPEYVFLAAGESGGIQANEKQPADLMIDNLTVSCNVVSAAHSYGVQKLLYIASSCCYPKECPQPMRPEYLLTGPLESTNEAYSVAKIAGLKLCEAYSRQYGDQFISAIPANVFGPGDDFSLEASHVIAGLMRKMHDAKLRHAQYVELWGTGSAQREFIFVDDVADACLFLMDNYHDSVPINIGAPTHRFSIKQLAVIIRDTVGFAGEINFDSSRSDGMPCKFLDSDPLQNLGWFAKTDFRSALNATYEYSFQKQGVVPHV